MAWKAIGFAALIYFLLAILAADTAVSVSSLNAISPPPLATPPGALTLQQRDLLAQETMARGTVDLVRLGWVQAGASLIGALGLGLTIWLTLLSLRQTRRALDWTRQAQHLELRANIVASMVKLPELVVGDELTFKVSIRNLGDTPALNVRFNGVGKRLSSLNNDVEFAKLDAGLTLRTEHPPQSMVHGYIRTGTRVSAAQLRRLASLKEAWAFFIRVDYEDAFGESYTRTASWIRFGKDLNRVEQNLAWLRDLNAVDPLDTPLAGVTGG